MANTIREPLLGPGDVDLNFAAPLHEGQALVAGTRNGARMHTVSAANRPAARSRQGCWWTFRHLVVKGDV